MRGRISLFSLANFLTLFSEHVSSISYFDKEMWADISVMRTKKKRTRFKMPRTLFLFCLLR